MCGWAILQSCPPVLKVGTLLENSALTSQNISIVHMKFTCPFTSPAAILSVTEKQLECAFRMKKKNTPFGTLRIARVTATAASGTLVDTREVQKHALPAEHPENGPHTQCFYFKMWFRFSNIFSCLNLWTRMTWLNMTTLQNVMFRLLMAFIQCTLTIEWVPEWQFVDAHKWSIMVPIL